MIMKQLLITTLLLAGFTGAQAQATAMSRNSEQSNSDNYRSRTVHVNEFSNTEMTIKDGVITFSDLPDLNHPINAVLTNADGEQVRQARIAPQQNTLNIKRLPKGLYFVTIVYRSHSKKGFSFNL